LKNVQTKSVMMPGYRSDIFLIQNSPQQGDVSSPFTFSFFNRKM